MTRSITYSVNPDLDLVLERTVDVSRELVWRAWTTPEILKKWFTPAPWSTADCEIDLRPGGVFRTVMRSPEGQDFPYVGCYLEVIPQQRLVWTTLLGPGFRPLKPGTKDDAFAFTAIISMESVGAGTKYTAHVMHDDAGARAKHQEMGFHDGWGTALDQLVAVARVMETAHRG